MRRGFQYFYRMLVALKDVMLYNDDDAAARMYQLDHALIQPDGECTVLTEKYEENYDRPFATELLGQYVTTMLMWNYAVSINNMSTTVTSAPDDPTALQLELKRDIASCDV